MRQAQLIEKAIIHLHERGDLYRQALMAKAEAEHAYKLARSEAFLKAEGTIKDKEALADLAVKDLHLKYLTADATAAFAKGSLEDCRAVISARQSILSAESKTNNMQDLHAMKQI
jgi:hypothetical protein